MFQKMIFLLIRFLKNAYERMDLAYQKTYADKRTGKIFQEEIENRKTNNKKIFIKNTMDWARHKFLEDEGYLPPEVMIRSFAEMMFTQAKEKGDIDELNRLKEQED